MTFIRTIEQFQKYFYKASLLSIGCAVMSPLRTKTNATIFMTTAKSFKKSS